MQTLRIGFKTTLRTLYWLSVAVAPVILLVSSFLAASLERAGATTSETDVVEVQSDGVADSSGVYSYCPSILKMDGNYMTWWLAASSWGDSIGYKVTTSPSTMINYGYTTVLHGAQTGLSQAQGGMWDDQSDGDPSVLKIGGVYYLYYDGNNWDDPATEQGGIGVAVSYDNGVTFTKLYGGAALIQETHDATEWGDGAPQVAVGPDGYYYMIYVHFLTASTESYRVIKSTDPTFATYTLVTDIPKATFSPTGYAGDPDLEWDPNINSWLLSFNYNTGGGTSNKEGMWRCSPDWSTLTDVRYLNFTATQAFGEQASLTHNPDGSITDSLSNGLDLLEFFGAYWGPNNGLPQWISGGAYYAQLRSNISDYVISSNAASSGTTWPSGSAFDRSEGTCWSSVSHATATATEWVQGTWSTATPVNTIRLFPRYIGTTSYAFPQNFSISYTTNGGSAWTTWQTYTNYAQPSGGGWIDLTMPSSQTINGIRMTATTLRVDNTGSYYFQLAEMEAANQIGLHGVATAVTPAVTLSVPPVYDWATWGLADSTTLNHMSGVTQQISNYTVVNGGTPTRFTNNPTTFSFTGGTPTASATNSTTGVLMTGLNNGFKFTVPASTTPHILNVYVGAYYATGTLTATLSDNSSPPYVETVTSPSSYSESMFTIYFQAASASKTLTVSYVLTSPGAGQVTLSGAVLQ